MTHKLRWLALSGLMAALAASAAACGSDDDTAPEQRTRCTDVQCGSDSNVTCDPADGECKCGGVGGLICLPGESCVFDQQKEDPSCVATICVGIACAGGTTCDEIDGQCKCGGVTCGAGEICTAEMCESSGLCDDVVCSAGEECDGADGACKCGGLGGAVCSFGEACVDGTCVRDECAGVNCGPGTFCNPDDGQCHCGAVDGPACTSGQACSDDDGTPVCVGVDVCANTFCPVGMVCDPTSDGVCRCGGIGPTNPICSDAQTCDMARAICLGGDQCANVVCENGNSCNDENGTCGCGGLGSLPCDDGMLCVALNNAAACAQPCSPIGPNTCGEGKMCVYDATQAHPASFCVNVPASPVELDRPCSSPFVCEAGSHCDMSGNQKICQSYCQFGPGSIQGCAADEVCSDVFGSSDGLGLCKPR